MTVDLFCINSESKEAPFKRIIFNKQTLTEEWTDFLKNFSSCPHPLKGKTLKVASTGTNPFIFTDYDRKIVYSEKGRPLGTNTGIAESLGKALHFEVEIRPLQTYDYFDAKTNKWIGMTGQVIFLLTVLACHNNQHQIGQI